MMSNMDDGRYYETPLARQELLVGHQSTARVRAANVLLCGVGGVGSWVAETLVRSGIGHLIIVDFDTIKPSNLNRQAEALNSTIGKSKCAVMAERLKDISTDCEIVYYERRLTEENIPALLDERKWDAVVDCIDDRNAKLALLEQCVKRNLRVVSSMGAAGKVEPECITTADISNTDGCPVAKLMRKSLRKRGIDHGVTCVYSPELPVLYTMPDAEEVGERRPLGSLMLVTASFGLRVADAVLRPILQLNTLPHRGGWRRK